MDLYHHIIKDIFPVHKNMTIFSNNKEGIMSKKEFFELFIEELKDAYSAEKQLIKSLPNMVNAASSKELKSALEAHLQETHEQANRLKRIFQILNVAEGEETCEAMSGLIEEGNEIVHRFPKSLIRDAGIIARAQCIEHYEIALYGTLKTFAKEFELDEVEELLQATLNEEGSANKKLTKIAEGGLFASGINAKAHSKS